MVRFLIVRFSSIGDIILTTPVVRHLKQQVENAEIHYLTKSGFTPLLEGNPYIDRIHSYDGDLKETIRELRRCDIDYIIDLQHNLRSGRIKYGMKRMDFTVRKLNIRKWLYVNFKWNRMPDLHMVDRNLDTIRTFITEPDQEGLDYFIPEKYELNPEMLPDPFQKGFLALAIGGKHHTKKLPVDLLIQFCSLLVHPVVILGGEEDRNAGEEIIRALPDKEIINGCGRFSIHQSASLVRRCRILVTHDTGLMHIGAAFGKKIISIWGNTVPQFGMVPYRADPESRIFEVAGLRCRPCSKIGFRKCPKKHFRCMVGQDIPLIVRTADRLYHATGQ